MTIALFKRNLALFFSQPLLFYVWLIPAWLLLGLSRAAILTLSFKRIAAKLGTNVGPDARVPLATAKDQRRAAIIGKTIRVAARVTPWTSNCFPQAITARLVLGVYNIPLALFFGVRRENKDSALQAHAWVVTGRVNVTGGRSFGRYTTVACFESG